MATIRWWRQPSPIGDLAVGATDSGVCLVAWDDSDDPELSLAGSEHEVINERVEPVAAAFERYFRGEREAVAELDVDLCLVGTEFRREVLGELHRLPVGTSTTYGQLGAAVGRIPSQL
jgi:O6-methylguanine-DNA--protein-cysteine methyltransferase